jgi:hypothetical protein
VRTRAAPHQAARRGHRLQGGPGRGEFSRRSSPGSPGSVRDVTAGGAEAPSKHRVGTDAAPKPPTLTRTSRARLPFTVMVNRDLCCLLSPVVCLVSSARSTWKWRGYNIRYQHAGSSGPALVLIHGFGANRCASSHVVLCLQIVRHLFREFINCCCTSLHITAYC